MSWMTGFVFLTAFLGTFGLIKVYKELALKMNLMDLPNERSSHQNPTPRGAGIVFLILFMLSIGSLFALEGLSFKGFYILCVGTLVYTILGFIDDIKALSAYKRLVPQFLVSAWVLLELTSYLEVPFVVKFLPWDSQILAFVFGVLFLMWMVNLFNFMDGLDGFLGAQTFIIALCSYALSALQEESGLGLIYLLIAVVVVPFLYFNWRPAKIFMGDAGAYFLGFLFAVLGLMGKIDFNISLVAQVILMGALICDATLTLIFRLIRTGKVFQGHRTHAFQILRHQYKWRTSHIIWLYLSLALFWFFPWSLLALYWPTYSVALCFVSYAPVLVGFYLLGVGKEDLKNLHL